MERIPFNRPFTTGREFEFIQEAIAGAHLSGSGPFTRRCAGWLEETTGAAAALLTTSCATALELAALVAGWGEGDEVIMPSFTFVSTATAVALRGATPVFVDIRPDTLNLDEEQVEAACTERTRAIFAVHYAGVGCELDALAGIARERGLLLVEDAAQGLLSTYRGRALGTVGAFGAISFHETKNVTSGEGGALLVNDESWLERARIAHEKGTNRSEFMRGEVDRYTWIELGSSFAPSEISAAFLWAQIEQARDITARRLELWHAYHDAFAELEALGHVRRPVVPGHCEPNGHMYYLLVPDADRRAGLIESLAGRGVHAVFHYVPLHSSPAGRRYGRAAGELPVTDDLSARLVRLPLWVGVDEALGRVVDGVYEALLQPTGLRRPG